MHMLVDAGSARPKSAANANGTLFVSLVHIHLSVLKFFLHDFVSCVGACTASSVCMWLLSVSHFFFCISPFNSEICLKGSFIKLKPNERREQYLPPGCAYDV